MNMKLQCAKVCWNCGNCDDWDGDGDECKHAPELMAEDFDVFVCDEFVWKDSIPQAERW